VRKIIESTLVSADGVIGDPPRWAMEYRDAEVTAEALERLASADAMLMGRGTYELFSAVSVPRRAEAGPGVLRGEDLRHGRGRPDLSPRGTARVSGLEFPPHA
jgi:hypothetical protein